MNLGVYLHIPFCRQKCLYCDFPSYVIPESEYDAYIDALCREIDDKSKQITPSFFVDSIFIGGGTPTLLSAESLVKLLACVKDKFSVIEDAEISIEANPGTVNREKLLVLRQQGLNRISFGIQSFSDLLLQKMGRIHSTTSALAAVDMASAAGFENINIDLIYGLPGQTLEDVQTSLNIAVELPIKHMSVYGLKVEEGTPFASLQDQGVLDLPDEDVEDAMYEHIISFLTQNGYKRYEISNFAAQGWECQHNLKYWRYHPYIGMGAAAHSFYNGKRQANVASVSRYCNDIVQGRKVVAFEEVLSPEAAMAEFTFLALRTVDGLNLQDFYQHFQINFYERYGKIINNLLKKNLVLANTDSIRLTPAGLKYGNQVFSAFLP